MRTTDPPSAPGRGSPPGRRCPGAPASARPSAAKPALASRRTGSSALPVSHVASPEGWREATSRSPRKPAWLPSSPASGNCNMPLASTVVRPGSCAVKPDTFQRRRASAPRCRPARRPAGCRGSSYRRRRWPAGRRRSSPASAGAASAQASTAGTPAVRENEVATPPETAACPAPRRPASPACPGSRHGSADRPRR
jgi:hypothetical protein